MQLQHLQFTALLTDGGLHPCRTLAHVVVELKAVAINENSICAYADVLAQQTWDAMQASLVSRNPEGAKLLSLETKLPVSDAPPLPGLDDEYSVKVRVLAAVEAQLSNFNGTGEEHLVLLNQRDRLTLEIVAIEEAAKLAKEGK